jgi:transcriptional regulator with XRE-family HTH domain
MARLLGRRQCGAMSKTARPEAYTAVQTVIGQRIMWARELVYPNASEFARLIEVHPSTLKKIEDGERAPSIFNVIEIANRLRVSADFVLRGQLIGIDQELERLLIAHHPSLVLGQQDRDKDMDDIARPDGKRKRPKRPSPQANQPR